jgi:hypothetical protein
MSDPRDDLRATQHSIRRDAERIKALEDEKGELDPSDPRVRSLSEQIERLAEGLRDKAAAETDLTEETATSG